MHQYYSDTTLCAYTASLYICSAQFANLCNFKIVLHKLEILKLQTNFEIAQPLLHIPLSKLVCNFEISNLHSTVSKLHKLRGTYTSLFGTQLCTTTKLTYIMTVYFTPNNSFTANDVWFYNSESWLATLHVAVSFQFIVYTNIMFTKR